MNNTMLCAIPARSGSKRIPGKNLKNLAGKPLIAYSIQAAIASKLFDAVYVCTDDEDIAEVARSYGAEVPLLMPATLCDDLVASHIPCQHLAKHLAKEERTYETLLCLQPTSPLRSAEDIKKGVDRFAKGDLDFLVSTTPIDPHYFHWALMQEQGKETWKLHFGEKWLIERPLLPTAHRPNGSIKIARLGPLQKTGHFFGQPLGIVETPEERSVHIGSPLEWDFCAFLLSRS